MSCDAKIRPFPDDTEVVCEEDHPGALHVGIIRDYAYPGSMTTMRWDDGDRRCYHGAWPGKCPDCGPAVQTPLGHRGGHAQ